MSDARALARSHLAAALAAVAVLLLIMMVAGGIAVMPRACQATAAMGHAHLEVTDRSEDCAAGWYARRHGAG